MPSLLDFVELLPTLVDAGSPAPASRAAPLAIVTHLARTLEANEIPYCHFKSNQHIAEAARGETDLDVLVERRSGTRLAAALGDLGFKRFDPPPVGGYPGVEDYLGMDEATGRLVHLHLHHQLTAGERHLKGYRLPWEELALSTRTRDDETGLYVTDPNLEMVLLLVRYGLKLRTRDWLRRFAVGDRRNAELDPEYVWLRTRTQPACVIGLTRLLLGDEAGRVMGQLLDRGPSMERLASLRRAASPMLRMYRTYPPVVAHIKRWKRELQAVGVHVGKHVSELCGPLSRTNPRGGIVVSLVGPDGSGKSRISTELAAWLGWKIDARAIYFGSGEGHSSMIRRPLKGMQRIARDHGWYESRMRPAGTTPPAPKPGGMMRRVMRRMETSARIAWSLLLALEKRDRLMRAWRARNRGITVICDRYPQNQIAGFNDGPLLDRWHRSSRSTLRALAEWESAPYRWAVVNPPDLVIKLNVSPEVAIARKPEMTPAEIRRRSRAVSTLQYPRSTRVVVVDADRPWDLVLLECKRELWDAL